MSAAVVPGAKFVACTVTGPAVCGCGGAAAPRMDMPGPLGAFEGGFGVGCEGVVVEGDVMFAWEEAFLLLMAVAMRL